MTCWSETRSNQEAILTSALPLRFWSPKTNYFAAVYPYFGLAPNFNMLTTLQRHFRKRDTACFATSAVPFFENTSSEIFSVLPSPPK